MVALYKSDHSCVHFIDGQKSAVNRHQSFLQVAWVFRSGSIQRTVMAHVKNGTQSPVDPADLIAGFKLISASKRAQLSADGSIVRDRTPSDLEQMTAVWKAIRTLAEEHGGSYLSHHLKNITEEELLDKFSEIAAKRKRDHPGGYVNCGGPISQRQFDHYRENVALMADLKRKKYHEGFKMSNSDKEVPSHVRLEKQIQCKAATPSGGKRCLNKTWYGCTTCGVTPRGKDRPCQTGRSVWNAIKATPAS